MFFNRAKITFVGKLFNEIERQYDFKRNNIIG